jgi:hypothetical protein
MNVQNEEKKMLIESMKKLVSYQSTQIDTCRATPSAKTRYSKPSPSRISTRFSLISKMTINVNFPIARFEKNFSPPPL